jgi:hypothetical protein
MTEEGTEWPDEAMEGWYSDPYGRHEARWMSQGRATHLVRDGDVEGNDPVTHEPFTVTPVRVAVPPPEHGHQSDLRRADDAEREPPYDQKAAFRAAADVYDVAGVGSPAVFHPRGPHLAFKKQYLATAILLAVIVGVTALFAFGVL